MKSSQTTLDQRVSQALNRSPHLSGHHLKPNTRDGHVVLHGSVGTYFQKQMAQEAIRRIDGVSGIANELIVIDAHHGPDHRIHF